jgi:hypothetical protein
MRPDSIETFPLDIERELYFTRVRFGRFRRRAIRRTGLAARLDVHLIYRYRHIVFLNLHPNRRV